MKTNRCNIDWNGEKVTINGEPISFKFPLKDAKQTVACVTGHIPDGVPAYKNFNNNYGITAAKAKKVINGIYYSNVYKPYKGLVDTYCYGYRGTIRSDIFRLVLENVKVIEQYERDGLHHLAPFAAYTGKSTQELRKEYGKSLWKKLCKNSFTRNLLICKKVYTSTPRYGQEVSVSEVNKLPSTLLKIQHPVSPRATLWALNQKENHLPLATFVKSRTFWHLEVLYRDTLRLSENLNTMFLDNWDSTQMKARHDAYMNLYAEQRMIRSIREYDTLSKITVDKGEVGDYGYRLLKTEAEIIDEGTAMHHCVGMYASNVARGTYLVYSVTNNKDKSLRYTLGVSVSNRDGKPSFNVDQQYRACNRYVSEDALVVSNEIIKMLNNQDINIEEKENV